MSTISWETFDADKPNYKFENAIKKEAYRILLAKGVNNDDPKEVRAFVKREIARYSSELDETIGIEIFRPHEFDAIRYNDESLTELRTWLSKQSFEWRNGSKTVSIALDKAFHSGGQKSIKGGRETVILDNLVVIKERKVAVEIETSNNIDNGYWTLRQAIRSGRADYGVMIVHWTAEGKGRADEGKARGRLDREFDGKTSPEDGPIYLILIVRLIDAYRLILKDLVGY